ncbi:GFA family protein [Kordiimonas marina]|uniref:GFA family protein n=1 Tax=Kordiimonas marina TaxID=2872312 RepID=UPI001FF41710|nr:GFA family protein [Kordiimonas marina]MCJ9428995.1 GFA family protein [Kordiimonas marina]
MADLRQGGCLCGAARYEINLDGHQTGNCHCTDCQKNSGGPFMTFTSVPEGQLRWISRPEGEARASDKAVRRFCAKCGTPLTWDGGKGNNNNVSTGSLDDPSGLEISYEIFTDSRWATIPPLAGARQYKRDSAGT